VQLLKSIFRIYRKSVQLFLRTKALWIFPAFIAVLVMADSLIRYSLKDLRVPSYLFPFSFWDVIGSLRADPVGLIGVLLVLTSQFITNDYAKYYLGLRSLLMLHVSVALVLVAAYLYVGKRSIAGRIGFALFIAACLYFRRYSDELFQLGPGQYTYSLRWSLDAFAGFFSRIALRSILTTVVLVCIHSALNGKRIAFENVRWESSRLFVGIFLCYFIIHLLGEILISPFFAYHFWADRGTALGTQGLLYRISRTAGSFLYIYIYLASLLVAVAAFFLPYVVVVERRLRLPDVFRRLLHFWKNAYGAALLFVGASGLLALVLYVGVSACASLWDSFLSDSKATIIIAFFGIVLSSFSIIIMVATMKFYSEFSKRKLV
jgi:hypothetical protein